MIRLPPPRVRYILYIGDVIQRVNHFAAVPAPKVYRDPHYVSLRYRTRDATYANQTAIVDAIQNADLAVLRTPQ